VLRRFITRSIAILGGTIACLAMMGSVTVYSERAAPMTVQLDQLVHSPEKFDGKLVRVSGFMVVSSHHVRAILLHQDEKPVSDPKGISVLVDVSNSRFQAFEDLKSGWVEITARAGVIQAGGGKRGPVLRQIREVQRIR
jgi:hypothetical protein